jgi:hypothetical protein
MLMFQANITLATTEFIPDQSNAFLRWGPLIESSCSSPHLSDNMAPCIKERRHNNTNLVMAQELIYRPFKLRLPQLYNSTHKDFWVSCALRLGRMRVSEDREWAEYPTQFAQNMVFQNAVYTGTPQADTWSADGCMSGAVKHDSFLKAAGDDKDFVADRDVLIIATSPDSWSFQHFLDRVAVVWSQAQFTYARQAMHFSLDLNFPQCS